jgi:NADPH:quinone reductase-like Zn-dependent oxidoreductase
VLAPKPATIGHVESAAVPLAALSAWQALFDHGRLREGQRVLVHGGVGGFAVQLARWRGAHVAATASTGNVAAARRLGADQVVDHLASRFAAGRADRGGGTAVTRIWWAMGGSGVSRRSG